MTEPSRRLAAGELGVPAEAGPAAARRAFLAQLAEADFVPPEAALAAVARLGGANPPLPPGAADEVARYEQADLDAFLGEYWSLEPARRRRRDELAARAGDPAVRARLAGLEAGLDVPAVPRGGAQGEVAELIRELYLLARGRGRSGGWNGAPAGRPARRWRRPRGSSDKMTASWPPSNRC